MVAPWPLLTRPTPALLSPLSSLHPHLTVVDMLRAATWDVLVLVSAANFSKNYIEFGDL
jgi:hypothetical protein